MSGITGIYYLNARPVEKAEIGRMTDILAHRGPDGSRVWCENFIGFGHQMLWTTPESLHERLPLQKGALAITADARVDNRDDLIRVLGFERYCSEKISDSELILAAYEKWGEACPEHLLGDFAFAIWDGRTQTIFCARDYFGVRPFYYHYVPDKIFAFGSEIKALLQLSEVPRRLNETKVGDHLALLTNDKAITFYQDIFRLPPAHRLIISPKHINLEPYWVLDSTKELKLASDTEYAEAYLDVFAKAIQCRLRSAYAIGSALSGGLDSSSIVGVAKEQLARQNRFPLHTFSAVFDTVLESDERPYIQAVIDRGDVHPHFVRADLLTPLTEIEQVLHYQDEPFSTPNLFMHWGLYTAAQQQGVRVFLDGYMGDNVVCHGWEYLIDLTQAGQYIPLIKQLWGIAKRHPGYSFPALLKNYLWDLSLKTKVPKSIKQIWRQLRKKSPSSQPNHKPSLFNPSFVEQVDLSNRIRAQQFKPLPHLSAAKNRRYEDLISGDMPLALEIANKTAAPFGIEPTYPFSDRRLAEFCLALPDNQRIHDGFSRMIVRRALQNHLPDQVCWRSGKGNLGYNFCEGLLNQERPRLDALLLENTVNLHPYINLSTLSQIYQDPDLYETRSELIMNLWLVVSFAIWLKQKPFELPSAPHKTG